MTPWLCATCAVEQPPAPSPPPTCAICLDERQWVPAVGQLWTTFEELSDSGRHGRLHELEPGLTSVEVVPAVGIGQRALIVTTPDGNVLWDCPGYLDDDMAEAVAALGGLAAIGVSHPHFYGAMVSWSHAFGDVPVYVAAADLQWVQWRDDVVTPWSDETEPVAGVRLLQCGGHFEGSAALHFRAPSDGAGVVLVSDTAGVTADRRFVTFMRSFPNFLPLGRTAVEGVVAALTRYPVERIYGAWSGQQILGDGAAVIRRSGERYVRWITDDYGAV